MSASAASSGAGGLVVVGDLLLDRDVHGEAHRLCPDSPAPVLERQRTLSRPGGAGLAALVSARAGVATTLVAPFGDDQLSHEALALLAAAGVTVVALATDGETAEKLRVRAGDQTLVRLDRGRSGAVHLDGATARRVEVALGAAGAVVVADYARGTAAHPGLRGLLAAAAGHRPTVWDPHPRGPGPVRGAWLLTPNQHEVSAAGRGSLPAAAAAARSLRDRHGARGVAVTLGARGALLVADDGPPLVCPCVRPASGDVSGAGDAFAAGAATALASGAVLSEAVAAGVVAGGAFVASGHRGTWFDEAGAPVDPLPRSGTPEGPEPRCQPGPAGDASAIVARTRAAGGTVVMTGGCFDLLHPGHVQLLRRARALGDCLVVCLNSDRSVRRLKGPARPVARAEDRAGVLDALEAVDGVIVFDDDTPVEVLRRHRPDLFVKGGDYGGADLPEAEAMAEWGGQVVIVPYVDGHSTTRLLQEALHDR